MQQVKRVTPNTSGSAAAVAFGVLAVWFAGYMGVDLSAEEGTAFGALIVGFGVGVATHGIVGLGRVIVFGEKQDATEETGAGVIDHAAEEQVEVEKTPVPVKQKKRKKRKKC